MGFEQNQEMSDKPTDNNQFDYGEKAYDHRFVQILMPSMLHG